MEPIDSLGEEISLHRPLCKPLLLSTALYFHFIYSFYMTKGLVRITCWGENYRCECKSLACRVLQKLSGSEERCWKADGVVFKRYKPAGYFSSSHWMFFPHNMAICMTFQYIHDRQIMNAVSHRCTLHQQQKETLWCIHQAIKRQMKHQL